MTPSKRNTLILALVAAISAYFFQQADNFWGLVTASLIVVWALIGALPIMDSAWRTKVGFVVAVFFGSLIALWPTFEGMSDGRIKCPAYVKNHITFGIVKGLDLQGGLRLVYTVEVEEAIRDKRDKLADQMRNELAVAYKFHEGDGLLKRESLTKLEEKVHVATPETALIKIAFKDPADVKYVDDRFKTKFGSELALVAGGTGEVVFKIRQEGETDIREQRGQPGQGHHRPSRRRARPAARPPSRSATRTSSSRSPARTRRPSPRSARSSARRRASSSSWSTTPSTSSTPSGAPAATGCPRASASSPKRPPWAPARPTA